MHCLQGSFYRWTSPHNPHTHTHTCRITGLRGHSTTTDLEQCAVLRCAYKSSPVHQTHGCHVTMVTDVRARTASMWYPDTMYCQGLTGSSNLHHGLYGVVTEAGCILNLKWASEPEQWTGWTISRVYGGETKLSGIWEMQLEAGVQVAFAARSTRIEKTRRQKWSQWRTESRLHNTHIA